MENHEKNIQYRSDVRLRKLREAVWEPREAPKQKPKPMTPQDHWIGVCFGPLPDPILKLREPILKLRELRELLREPREAPKKRPKPMILQDHWIGACFGPLPDPILVAAQSLTCQRRKCSVKARSMFCT